MRGVAAGFALSAVLFCAPPRQVIAATNRVDTLDPALLRSGRIDRKVEFPLPTEEARARIMQIHSRKMNVSSEVNFEELGRRADGPLEAREGERPEQQAEAERRERGGDVGGT